MKTKTVTILKKLNAGIFFVLGGLFVFACQDEMQEGRQFTADDEISFTLLSDTAWNSRSIISQSSAIVSQRQFLGLMGNDSLFITLTEEVNDVPVFRTDSTGNSSRNIYSAAGFTQFYLNAFVENGSEFMKNQLVKKSGSNWTYSPIKYWPQEQAVHFFGYASNMVDKQISPACSMANGIYSGTFDYTLPTANGLTDAEMQPDLVYSIVPNQNKQAVGGKVALPFYHALSAVSFKLSGTPKDITPPETWKIGFKGITTSGTCTYAYQAGSPISFSWSQTNTDGIYTQTYRKINDQLQCNEQNTFALIPQTLDDVLLQVSFTYAGMDYHLETPISGFNDGKWGANKKYIYTISISETVEVEIEDRCTDTVKDQLVMRNTGLSDAYFRATIVGYWENSDGNVVGWWNAENETVGTFTNLADANYWLKGEDGYYYYKYPVKVGATPTRPLFDKYELKQSDGNGSVLKLSVLVQAVKYEEEQTSLKAAWGDVSTGISKTFE